MRLGSGFGAGTGRRVGGPGLRPGRPGSKKPGKSLGQWGGETETRKPNKAERFEQLASAGETQDLTCPSQGHSRANGSGLSSLTRGHTAPRPKTTGSSRRGKPAQGESGHWNRGSERGERPPTPLSAPLPGAAAPPESLHLPHTTLLPKGGRGVSGSVPAPSQAADL